ncbi:hypothetical protein LCGC14_1282060 [marine sediment metagenome]|uniref:Uncharacterized protein n=1 Tax=marine sediment metagenome TaxID=412755 RepID=A0A0F9KWK4_9ZZZZ
MNEVQEQQLKEIHETVIAIAPMVKDHHNTLYGNGQPGLVKQVTQLETKIKTNKGNIQLTISIILCIVALISVTIAILK